MSLLRSSLHNPLIVNLSLVIIAVMGISCWYLLPQEIFPVVDLDLVHIQTSFDGASPTEVEQQVTLVIEEEFKDAQDIEHISSISHEGGSDIYIKLKPGSNVDDFIRHTRTLLDRIDGLPETIEEPELARIQARFPVITLTLYGQVVDAELYKYSEIVRQKIQAIQGIARVSKAGVRDWELWVEIDPHVLSALGVSMEEIHMALRANLQDQPGGSIKSTEGDIRLRGKGVEPLPEQVERIVLRAHADGGRLLIGDVAQVSMRFEEAKSYARFNGQPSTNLTITKTADASVIEVANQVKQLVDDELPHILPPGIHASYHTDISNYVKIRLNTVKSSGVLGLVLVILSLYLLLNFRIALITAFGIPVSFFFAIILLYYFNYTINMVSLFAFLIVLGVVVDDAIIVTENIYRNIEQGIAPFDAAIIGAQEVFWPVVVSTLTTIAAFLPMMAIGGTMGEFIRVIPVVVCCALLGSFFESFAVLPAHAGHLLRMEGEKTSPINWKRLLGRYEVLLRWCVLNRYFVASLSVALLAISLVYAYTRLPFQLFGDVETGQFFINIEAPNTYSLEDSLALTKRIEDKIYQVIEEQELASLLSNIGISVIDFNRSKSGSNIIQFVVDLEKPVAHGFVEHWIVPLVSLGFDNFGERVRSTDVIIEAFRQPIQTIPGVQRMAILRPDAGPAGDDIEIGISSQDPRLMQEKAGEIKDYLNRLPGVNDIVHDQEPGKLEYQYKLNEQGKRLGLSQSQIATAVRSGFLGDKVTHVNWQQARIPVRLIYIDSIRKRSASLGELPIVLDQDRTVFLGDVADISITRGPNQIRRRDYQRMAKITANVDTRLTTASQVTDLIAQKYGGEGRSSGYTLLYLGEKKEAKESFSSMGHALFIALVVIFFMLTVLFKSLFDALLVMLAIPFGIIGVVIGHALFGYNLQFLSIVGVLALSGIIVNDSLILIDFAKRLRAEGQDRLSAIVSAGKIRARPIIITTMTTFLGISPLIFFVTGQTAFLSPMAVSLGFGLLASTILVLLTLPCLYLIADDLRGKLLPIVWRR